jgi:uncharacterized protein YfdQ (DUF2303 family)
MGDEIVDINVAHTNAAAGYAAGYEVATAERNLAAKIQRFEEGRPYRIRPNGTIELVERLLSVPAWRRGEVTFYEALSFSRFIKRFKNETTVLFADRVGVRFTAALDYHPSGGQQDNGSWDLFRAILPLRHTPSWETWAGANKTAMDQATFAQFLEDNIPDIAEPAGAKLVELARTLEAKTDVQFDSHIRAENGAHRFIFIENVTASSSGTSGKIDVPPEFTLVLQPFHGSKSYETKARLRYRISAKRLALWFELVRLQDVLDEAFNDELMKIVAEVGEDTPCYNGPAPAPQVPPKAAADGTE